MPSKPSSTRRSSSRTSRGRSTTARGARGRATSRAKGRSRAASARSKSSPRGKSSGRRATSARRVGTARRTSRARTTTTSPVSTTNLTTDHDIIRRWAEAHGARPASVRGTGGPGDIGVLRLDFPGYTGAETLEHISWDEWFEKFDERDLALLYQDTTAAAEPSNFNKLVSRSGVEGE